MANDPASSEELSNLLDHLPESDRELIIAAYVEKKSYAEIATKLGLSASHVRFRTYRAVQQLKKAIGNRLSKKNTESVNSPSISVYLDPGDSPEELLTEFYIALSSLYLAHGGSGLKIAKDELRSFAGEAS